MKTDKMRAEKINIGGRDFMTSGHAYVMGILNVTPDSFSDGGKWISRDAALRHVGEMIKDGMDIVDVGGESTRPGHTQISDDEEIERVVPVIEGIKANFDVPVSIDTYKSGVAKAGISAGADMINDIWGLKYDRQMGKVISESGAACCLMHNNDNTDYKNFMEEVCSDLEESLNIAKKAGIKDEKIILDPGVGFGKTYEQNLEIIGRMDCLLRFGYPLLLGASRKSVIGLTLDTQVHDRLEGTLVAAVFGVLKGAMFIRVHDVKENVRAIRMAEAVLGSIR